MGGGRQGTNLITRPITITITFTFTFTITIGPLDENGATRGDNFACNELYIHITMLPSHVTRVRDISTLAVVCSGLQVQLPLPDKIMSCAGSRPRIDVSLC